MENREYRVVKIFMWKFFWSTIFFVWDTQQNFENKIFVFHDNLENTI